MPSALWPPVGSGCWATWCGCSLCPYGSTSHWTPFAALAPPNLKTKHSSITKPLLWHHISHRGVHSVSLFLFIATVESPNSAVCLFSCPSLRWLHLLPPFHSEDPALSAAPARLMFSKAGSPFFVLSSFPSASPATPSEVPLHYLISKCWKDLMLCSSSFSATAYILSLCDLFQCCGFWCHSMW